MRYIFKHQLIRFTAIALMVGYTYLQFHRMKDMSKLDWYIVLAVDALGFLLIVLTTAKIKIASAHMEHHRQEGNKHHGPTS
jgi:hypothetical protein